MDYISKKLKITIAFTFLFLFSFTFGEERKEKDSIRVISLSPAITETLYYFGYGNSIVGRTDYCNYPEEVKKIDSLGSMYSPNIEMVVSKNPDYIISQSHFNKNVDVVMKNMGVKTIKFGTPKNIISIIDEYKRLVELFSKDDKDNKKIYELEKFVQEIKKNGDQIKKRPKVYFSLGAGHSEYTAGKNSFISDAIEISGGENIVKEEGWTYSLEALLYDQPDILMMSSKRYEQMKSNKKYADLRALQDKKRIILVEESEITLPTPRLLTITLPKIQKVILDFNSVN